MSLHFVMFLLITADGLWSVSQIWDLLHWDVPAVQTKALVRAMWRRAGELLREMGI